MCELKQENSASEADVCRKGAWGSQQSTVDYARWTMFSVGLREAAMSS